MARKVDRQLGGKRAELYVIGELLKLGVVPYVPMVDVEGVDAVLGTPIGHIVELQIKSSGAAEGKEPRWFQMARIAPRKNFFIICVEFADAEPGDVWVFPSGVFGKYAARPPSGIRDLDLDTTPRKYGIPLKDLLCGFRNRWELIVNYEQYESLIESTENLEDILTMKEATEAPKDEAFTLEEYERRRAAAMLSSSPLVGED